MLQARWWVVQQVVIKTGYEYAPNMYESEAYEAYTQTGDMKYNPNGMTMRTPVEWNCCAMAKWDIQCILKVMKHRQLGEILVAAYRSKCC